MYKSNYPLCVCCRTNRVQNMANLFCKNCKRYIRSKENQEYVRRHRSLENNNNNEADLRRVYVYSETIKRVVEIYNKERIKTPNNRFNFPFVVDFLVNHKNIEVN